MFKNPLINNSFNFAQQQQQQQQHQNQQPYFFPSASVRQFSQQNLNNLNTSSNLNMPLFNDMNGAMYQQRIPPFMSQMQNPILSANGFPNFLPQTNFPPNNLNEPNTKDKINQLNSKFQMQQQSQTFQQINTNLDYQQNGMFLCFLFEVYNLACLATIRVFSEKK